jgi:hypothetical protein
MADTYYRIQSADRDPQDLIGDHHLSRVWVGHRERRCEECGGSGSIIDRSYRCPETGDYGEMSCKACDGQGWVEDLRRGVSVCDSIETLAAYLSERDYGSAEGQVVIELEGDISDDEDHDSTGQVGDPLLVHPTRIVSVRDAAEAQLEGGAQ